jgi:phage gp45-like
VVNRTNLSHTNNRATGGSSGRASVREIDDKHLMSQIKKADHGHSHTASDFERWQMVGLTSVPLKQEEEEQQGQQGQQGQSGSGGGGGNDGSDSWNHNQPKGKSAEAVMLYLGGNRDHPVGIVDDRRVRPYAMKEGETALYAASGTGQMLFHNDKGSYLVAVNNPPEQSKDDKEVERFASLRHVEKKKQSREIKKGQEVKEHPHEGETVNLEVRTTKKRIEFRAGDEVVGYYDKENKRWCFIGEMKLGSEDASHPVYGVNGGVGKTTKTSGAGAVLVKAPEAGPPTSLDTQA